MTIHWPAQTLRTLAACAALALLASGAGAAPLPAEAPHPPPSDNHYFDPAAQPPESAETALGGAAPLWRAAGEPSLWIWSKHAELEGVTVIRLSLVPADSGRAAKFVRIMVPEAGGDGVLEASMLGGLTEFGGGELADHSVRDFPAAQAENLLRVIEQLQIAGQPRLCDAGAGAPLAADDTMVVFEMASHDEYRLAACPRSARGPVARLASVFSQFHRFPPSR